VVKIIDALGNETNYEYDAVGNIINFTDANGHTTLYEYDALNRVVKIIDALGNETNYEYDAVGNIINFTDANGHTTLYEYDALNRVVKIIDALGNETNYEYDAVGNIINFTDANGHTTLYEYDALNRLISITDSTAISSYYTYDAMGNLNSYTDFRGYTTTYSYDALNRLISITDATGNSTYYAYDGVGNIISITNSRGHTTTYSYDSLNRLLSVTDSMGNTKSYEYDAVGNIINFTDARGYATLYTYDSLNRLIQIKDALGHTISYSYDAVGNRICSINENGYTTTYEYDALNRLIKWTNPLNHSIYYTYDAVGNKIRITDANGISTNYVYDELNQLICIIDAMGNIINYSYDPVGNLINVIDPNGGTYSYEYDSLNRIINFSLPSGKSTIYSYDENGNVISKILPNLNQLNYSYDSLNRLTQISYPDGNSISYSYDSGSNLISAVNNNGIGNVTIMYDENNRPISVETDYGTFTKSITYTYDEIGNIINITDGSFIIHYEYDELNRVVSISNSSSVFQFEYDNVSNRISLIYPNGMSVNYVYDKANRLINQTLRNSTDDVISYYAYTYDNSTNKLSINEIAGTTTFQYDLLYRIVNVTHPSGSFTKYTYDAIGNRLSKKESGNPAIIYTYDIDNKLLQEGNISYVYDSCGNLINKTTPNGTILYNYDWENRLIHVNNVGGMQIFYNYSPLGKRIEKTNASGTCYYLYDGIDILSELDINGNQTARYMHTPVIDETICMVRNDTSYFFEMDGLMNVRQIFNDSEVLKASYEYDAFGVILQQTGGANNPYRFKGREWDAEVGLYYYRNRYYDAEIGRFITQDPIGLKGGINLYTYVNNNPINFIDPFGLETKSTKALEEKIKELEEEIKSAEEALEEVNEEIKKLEEDIEKLTQLIDALGKDIERQRGEYPEKAAETLKKAWDIVSAFMPPTPKSLIELVPDAIEFLGSPVDPEEMGVPSKVATINWKLLPKLEETMKELDEKWEDFHRITEYIGELKNELDSLKLQLEKERAKEKNEVGGGGASDSGPHRPSGPPKTPPVPTGRGGRNPFPPMPIPQPSPKPPKAPPKPSGEKKPKGTSGGKEKGSAKDEIDVPDWSDLEEPILPGEIDWPISPPKPPKAPPKPSGEKKSKSVPTPKSKMKPSSEIMDPTGALYPKAGIPEIPSEYKNILKGEDNLYFISWNDAGIKDSNIHSGDYRNIGNDTLNVTVQNNGDYNITFMVNFSLERWGTCLVGVMNESFEGVFPPPGWQIYHLGNGNTWMQTNWPHMGNYSATINTTVPPPPVQNYNEWLITDSYNLSKIVSPMLSFWYFAWSSGIFNSDLQIWASTDGGTTPQDFINNGTLLTDIDPIPAMTWINEPVDLISLQGEENVHLAFVLAGEEYDFMEFYLDDVMIEGYELGWEEVDSGNNGPYEIDPEAWIESFFDVFYDAEGEYRATFSLDSPLKGDWSDDDPDNDVYQAIYMVVNDTTPPSIANVTANPSIQDVDKYVNITCDVTDDTGVATVRVNITFPDSSYINNTMANIADTDTYYFNRTYMVQGTYSFIIWAVDVVNNTSISVGGFAIQDLTPPGSRLTIGDPHYIDGIVTWVTSDTPFIITASDNDAVPDSAPELSEVKTIYYSIDGGPPMIYNGAFNLSGYPPSVPHSITYWSIDYANNTESTNEYHNIFIDDTPPELHNGNVEPTSGNESSVYRFNVTYFEDTGRAISLFTDPFIDVSPAVNDEHPRKVVDYEGNEHYVWMSNRDGKWEIYYKQIDPDGIKDHTATVQKITSKILVNDTRISDLNNSHSMYPSLALETHEEVFINDTIYKDKYAILAAPVRHYIDQQQKSYDNKVTVNQTPPPWQEYQPIKGLAKLPDGGYYIWIDVVIYKYANYTYNNSIPLTIEVRPQAPGGGPDYSPGVQPLFLHPVFPSEILDGYSWLAFYDMVSSDYIAGQKYCIILKSTQPYDWCYMNSDVYPNGDSSLGTDKDFTFIARYNWPEIRFKHEISMLRDYLLSEGYTDNNITVLTINYWIDNLRWRIPDEGYGYYDPQNFYWEWQPLPYDFNSESSWIDGDATYSNLWQALNQTRQNATIDDLIFINLMNHGGGWIPQCGCGGIANGNRPNGRSDPKIDNDEINDGMEEYFCTYSDPNEGWNKSNYWYDDELDIVLDQMSYKHMVVLVDTCHSGGFIPDISGPNRIILTSGREDETTYSYYYRFYERINISRSPDADVNGDGKISVREAHFYAVQQHPLEHNNRTIQHPQIDIWDNLHVVWADKRDGNSEIYYSKVGSIINCSSLNNGVDLTIPDIPVSAIDGNDSGRIVTNPVDGANAAFIEHPDIDIDSENNIHIVWSDERDGKWKIYYQKQDNGVLPTVIIDDMRIAGIWSTNISICPVIAIGTDDKVHIAWQDNFHGGIWEIFYQKQTNNGTVIVNDKVVTSIDGYNSTKPDIGVAPNGFVHIVFMDERQNDPGHEGEGTHKAGYWEIYTVRIDTTGKALKVKRQSDMKDPGTSYGVYTGPPDGYSMYPRITINNVGKNLFITWHDNRTGDWEIYYTEISTSCHNPNTDIRVTIDTDRDMYPDIALDRDSNPDVIWQSDRNGDWDVIWKSWNKDNSITVDIAGFSNHMLPYDPNDNDASDGIVYSYGTSLQPGFYNYSFYAFNGLLNANTSSYFGPLVNDTIPPEILNVSASPNSQMAEERVNITCNVTDNVAVNVVKVNITYPDSSYHNFSMNSGSYYYNATYSMIGTYHYFIWANDTSGNSNISSIYNFTIIQQPTVDYIFITFESKNEIFDCNISTNFSFIAYASAFNNTYGFIDFIDANWSIVNYASNASINASHGKSILFNSGWNDGTAILTAEYNGHNDSVVFNINSSLFSFMLYKGWNLITLPCENSYNASSLFNDIEGCSIILGWNANVQDFIIYVPGSPYDFAIENGKGYFIGMSHDSIFSLVDIPVQNVSVHLYIGWNILGWFNSWQTNASSLYNAIQGCTLVLKWNASMQDFDLYAPGVPNDFVIARGEGFLVAVDEESEWHGEG
ncbi:MAG TPA: hypothetical protein ENI33_04930, partial [Thermoplasmatales archaeon]|nr:hypothetical protein [Thermoplasmatales archaeon]